MKHIIYAAAMTLAMFQASAQRVPDITIYDSHDFTVTYTEDWGKPKVELRDASFNSILLDTGRIKPFLKQVNEAYKKAAAWNVQAVLMNISDVTKDLPQAFTTNGGNISDDGMKTTHKSNPIKFQFVHTQNLINGLLISCSQSEGLYHNLWFNRIQSEKDLNTFSTALDMNTIRRKVKEEKDKLNAFK